MALDPALSGRVFAPTAPYTVGREKIREFTAAIGAPPLEGGDVAPLTFPIVVAFQAMEQFMAEPGIGIELRHVVHADQRFEQSRPVRAGDTLTGTLQIDSLRSAAGMEMIGTRTEISTTDGEHVCTAYATLVHRAGSP